MIDTIYNFKDHPSIVKIKERINVKEKFSFSLVDEDSMKNEIKSLNINKPTTFNNFPAKILVDNFYICTSCITKIINDSVQSSNFPENLKMDDITLTHKKDETILKNIYRPVSILLCVSKLFERNMYDHGCSWKDIYQLICVAAAKDIIQNIV